MDALESAAAEVARELHVPLADVHGVIEFYSLLYSKPVGKRIIRVCTTLPARCEMREACWTTCALITICSRERWLRRSLTIEASRAWAVRTGAGSSCQ